MELMDDAGWLETLAREMGNAERVTVPSFSAPVDPPEKGAPVGRSIEMSPGAKYLRMSDELAREVESRLRAIADRIRVHLDQDVREVAHRADRGPV